MRFWRKGRHRRASTGGQPTPETRELLWQAQRGLFDAAHLDNAAAALADRLRETVRRNHIAEAVARSIRRTP